MKKYNVHCFELVRVMYEDIEASSPAEAAAKATEMTNITLPAMLNRYEEPEVECLLECTGYIVDPHDGFGGIAYDETTYLNQYMEDISAASKEEIGEGI
jgi:hypothetical protein